MILESKRNPDCRMCEHRCHLYLVNISGRVIRNRIRTGRNSHVKQLEWCTSDTVQPRWQLIGTFATTPINRARLLTSYKLTMRRVIDRFTWKPKNLPSQSSISDSSSHVRWSGGTGSFCKAAMAAFTYKPIEKKILQVGELHKWA